MAISGFHADLKCKKLLYTHGMGGLNFGKDYEMIKYVPRYNALLLNGPLQRRAIEIAAKMFNVKLPDLYEVGYLRGDRLRVKMKSYNKRNFYVNYNLKEKIPIVLYSPTWGDFASVKEWIDVVCEVCEKLGIYLFIKLHPLMLTYKDSNKTSGINWDEKLKHLKNKFSMVRVWQEQDIDEIMLASDLMITDVSGMALEYMVLEKPVVFLPAPKYFELYGYDRPEKWVRPEREIKDFTELKMAITNAINGDGFFYPVDKLVYNKDKSIEFIKKILSVFLK
jgi:CDP-glycerol glycerophosphotransferase (TagB/SpsB family)